MQWIYLILASCCEILWFYCIGYLNKFSLKELYTFDFLNKDNGAIILGAIAGYVLFGIFNMLFFTRAIQKISPSIAFSIWTGLALAGIAVVDGILANVQISFIQIGSIALILIGIIGLKFYGNS